jgi:hypothetical protein
MGKLVELSRKAAERESRWLETMWSLAPARSAKLEREIERAEIIDALKREIVEEELRIAEIESEKDQVRNYFNSY